jgi:hypothetical protein
MAAMRALLVDTNANTNDKSYFVTEVIEKFERKEKELNAASLAFFLLFRLVSSNRTKLFQNASSIRIYRDVFMRVSFNRVYLCVFLLAIYLFLR